MATVDPPPTITRIVEVMDPAGAFYVVYVRVPLHLASSFPDKPWGTRIDEIGLAPKDIVKFSDYVLVDIENISDRRIGDTADLFWIFQKLGGPVWSTTARSKENLKPAKFRGQVVAVRTEQEVEPGTEPTTLSGGLISSTVTQTPNSGKAVRVEITETIDENAGPLVGEKYGDIVTKSVSEILVEDGTPADTGIDIITSIVDPNGDGTSVKQTERAKAPGWPDPVEQEVSKEGADLPPVRYRKDLTRARTTRKIAPGSIPGIPTLSGNQVSKTYKKETPDRAEEAITTQTFTLNTSAIDEAVEQKPFISIRSRMTPGTTPVLPANGNGSARLVYEAPDGSKIYENTAEIATPRPGLKGVETEAQSWGSLVTTTNYTESSTASFGGSVQLIYNDGAVRMYESSTSQPEISGSTFDSDPKEWGTLTWYGTYSPAPDTSPGGRSRQVWSRGGSSVYLNETPSISLSGTSFVSAREENPLITETQRTSYGYSPNGGLNTRSRVAFTLGGNTIYENIEITRAPKGRKTYSGSVNVNIPPTLVSLNKLEFSRKDGTTVYRWEPVFSEGYSGPMKAEVIEYWAETPATLTPTVFRPSPLSFQTPRGGISVSSCLHPAINFLIAILSADDPEFEPQAWTAIFPATTPVSSLGMRVLADVDAQAYRDGYVIREYWVQL